MIRLIPLLLLVAGCPANVHAGIYASGQDGKTRRTSQPCQKSAEAVRAADIALPIIFALLVERGYCEDYERVVAEAKGKLSVCIIDQPEQCHPAMPWPRHGCADLWHVQQSIRWPPLCQEGMPPALKCVKSKDEQRVDWQKNFVHELTNVATQRCGIYDPSYQHEVRKLGPEIWRRYQAARGGET